MLWPTELIRHSRFSSRRTCRAFALVLTLLSTYSFAQVSAALGAPGVSVAAMLEMLLGLTLIIGILFLGTYFLRKLNGGRGFGNSGPLRIVGGLIISTRERIVLIEVGDAWIVVGIAPGQIKTLHTLPKGESITTQSGEKPFGQWLKQISERNNERK